MNDRRLVMERGPLDYEDAQIVHNQICHLTSLLLRAKTQGWAERCISELSLWFGWVVKSNEIIAGEAKRIEMCVNPMIVLDPVSRSELHEAARREIGGSNG